LTTDEVNRFGSAMDRIDLCDPRAVAACQTSSYGKALLRAGSFVIQAGRLRRLTPREVAKLLGYSNAFRWPADATDRRLWKLLGNSLSLPAVRYVLSHLPHGPAPVIPWP
jgi:DNA (cytosine-5)-methyltransferase 1/tRNA (cytosine38-C5)-methyltransferase